VGEDQAGDPGGEARGEEAVSHAVDGMEKGGGQLGGGRQDRRLGLTGRCRSAREEVLMAASAG
jgi:hypothetical protein